MEKIKTEKEYIYPDDNNKFGIYFFEYEKSIDNKVGTIGARSVDNRLIDWTREIELYYEKINKEGK
jgi:predicted AlkP superfamily phosphohydrolase/phosphomutase